MEFRHFLWARHLRGMGHRPAIISCGFHHLFASPPRNSAKLFFESHEQIPFAFVKAPAYARNDHRRMLNILSWSIRTGFSISSIEKKMGPPDIAIGSTPHPFVYLNLLHLKFRYGIPIVFEVRDLWPQMLIELGSLSKHHPLTLIFSAIEKIAYKYSDRVISLWHSADRYMLHNGLTPDRYVYLPNGIDIVDTEDEDETDWTHPLLQRVLREKENGRFLVGYGGSHGYANPIPTIYEACRLLRDKGIENVGFFLVGDGPVKQQYVHRADSSGLKNLHFHDPVPKKIIMAFYRLMDANYMGLKDMPLFKYGPTPNKLMDYMAVGRPIIYAINSSFNPVRACNGGLSISPDAPDQLVTAILKLRNMSKTQRDRIGAACRRYLKSNFDIRILSQRLGETLVDTVREYRLQSAMRRTTDSGTA